MSLNIYVLESHVKLFPLSIGGVSGEYGERFHQGITNIEKHYRRKWTADEMLCRLHESLALLQHIKIKEKEIYFS